MSVRSIWSSGVLPFDGKLITFCLPARPGEVYWAVCGTTANKINSVKGV